MKNADEPAFKRLTKREYFAAKAMEGMLAHTQRYRPRDKDGGMHWHFAMGCEATEIADALLSELERTS